MLVPGDRQLNCLREADDLLPKLTGARGERLRKKRNVVAQGGSVGDFSVKM